ncbi:RidA family protein [Arthrobacter sp. M4]|uniref:RidA family protein n=1 Tax=Arthrobacter sp. M4 TaxID=218160 RepID=UPI001CDD7E4C|nr:RidA family protein [Arthrobacter sp. M4]MCA4134813.1 RidA family protein [Arthrobacter sp. M4]
MMMEINIDTVPKGRHYSHAVRMGDLVFTTGQVPVDSGGNTVGNDIVAQARQVFANLEAVLSESGSSLRQVVRTTMYLTDIEAVSQLSDLRDEVFGESRPASVAVEVPRLWDLQHLIEIEVIATVSAR